MSSLTRPVATSYGRRSCLVRNSGIHPYGDQTAEMDDLGKGGGRLGGDARSVAEIVRTGSDQRFDQGVAPSREREPGAVAGRLGQAGSKHTCDSHTAAKEGRRRGRSQVGTSRAEMRTFGEQEVCGHARVETRFRAGI